MAESLPNSDLWTCPVCGAAVSPCARPECPPVPAAATEQEPCLETKTLDAVHRAEAIRNAALDTPFRLGI